MRRGMAFVVLLILAAGAASCSEDPETAKRRYFEQGNSYMEGKKYSEAILSYRNAIRLDDKFAEARLKLADAYLSTGDAQNGLRESVRAADLLPGNVDVQLRAGFILLVAKQYPEARARALAALTKEPRNPRALILLGNALAGLRDLDAAIEQVEEAIDSDPQLTLSYVNLGSLQLARGDRDAAEDAFRRAVAAAPDSSQAHAGLANFLWAAGDHAEAEKEFRASLAIDPTSPAVNRAIATFYSSQNRERDAEPYLKSYAEQSGTVDARLLRTDVAPLRFPRVHARGGSLLRDVAQCRLALGVEPALHARQVAHACRMRQIVGHRPDARE